MSTRAVVLQLLQKHLINQLGAKSFIALEMEFFGGGCSVTDATTGKVERVGEAELFRHDHYFLHLPQ